MSSRSSNIFAGKTPNKPNLGPALDADGRVIEFDVREDEEQNVKLTQTIDLLLAAGYFRARIKGLSPFDKVVGGMTWCITTCNVDVDVDLLFQENSTIGQKIALTEKIVSALPRMKCPHRIEPHQIQGLDFIHIYPVMQWLVKRAIETREEMGDYIRAYSISQFDRDHSLPEDAKFQEDKPSAVSSIQNIKEVYGPQRKFKRSHSLKSQDEETRVHSTLLEYGRRYGLSRGKQDEDDTPKGKSGGGQSAKEEESDVARQEEEEKRIQALMTGMAATNTADGKITASAVGSIVGMKSDEIQQIATEYANKQAELDKVEKGERAGGVQHHKRTVVSIQKQIQHQGKALQEVKEKHQELHQTYQETQEKLKEAESFSARLDLEIEKLSEMETDENEGVLETLRSLVSMNESLKKQEKEFKGHCKEEMSRLQKNINDLQTEGGLVDSEDHERAGMIDKQYAADKEKLHKIRLLLARKNREISALQRKIDEVPTRAELSQYQRRFVELYNQIAAKHKETKQFYTLYNTLDDTKLYFNKEVNLLNSVHDNFEQAMSSAANKEQFLKQFEQIVEGIKQNRSKVEKKKQEEKMRRDQLNDHFLDLVEKQRLYFKTVKDFKEECRKNEILSAKMHGRR